MRCAAPSASAGSWSAPAPLLGTEAQPEPKSLLVVVVPEEAGIEEAGIEEAGEDADD